MAEEIAYADIIQQYHKTLVLYKGEPVYVSSVGDEAPYRVRILQLLDQKQKVVNFSMEDFTAPAFRIGMVNTGNSVVYAVRRPVRRMQVGISANNLSVNHIDAAFYEEGPMEAIRNISRCTSVELGNAIKGAYPTFDEALAFVKGFKGAQAFDRQFAITSNRQIIYKTKAVGSLPKNCTRPERIQFDKGFEHLEILVGDNCGKTLCTVGQ